MDWEGSGLSQQLDKQVMILLDMYTTHKDVHVESRSFIQVHHAFAILYHQSLVYRKVGRNDG